MFEPVLDRHLTEKSLTISQRMFAGGSAGFMAWLLIYPMDVIKTRMMSQRQNDVLQKIQEARSGSREAGKKEFPLLYKSTWDCVKKSYQNEGPTVFFRGIAITLVRSVPVAVAVLPTYEFCVRVFTNEVAKLEASGES